jgi:hypothetical protein
MSRPTCELIRDADWQRQRSNTKDPEHEQLELQQMCFTAACRAHTTARGGYFCHSLSLFYLLPRLIDTNLS